MTRFTVLMWRPSEIIALVAVIVSACVAVLGPFLSGIVQKKRDVATFEHERAQTARLEAAKAYGMTRHLIRYVHPSRTRSLVKNPDGEHNLRTEIDAALSSLGVIAGLGWTPEVRDASVRLSSTLESLVMANWAYLGALRNGHHATTSDRVEQRWDTTWDALERFRLAISGESDGTIENPTEADSEVQDD